MKITCVLASITLMQCLHEVSCDVVERIHVGQSALLRCYSPSGTPSWKKNGNDVDLDGDPNVSRLQNGSLKIESATKHDVGDYDCIPPEGNPIRIVVLESPTVIPTSTTVPKNGTLTLRCMVNNNPRPTVEWLKDGKLLEETKNPTKTVRISDNGRVKNAKLEITPFQKSDEGKYSCKISYATVKTEPISSECDVHLSGSSRCVRISGGLLLAAMLIILFLNCQH